MRITLLLFLALLPLRAEDWTTTDGKTFHGVIVVKVEDDAVTILDSDGGARVPLKMLNAALQKKFHYDPAKAAIAAQKFAQQDEQERLAVEEAQDHPPQAAAQSAPTSAPAPTAAPTPHQAATPPSSQARAGLTDDQRSAIQAQIKSLQDDIAFMQREIAKESSDGHRLKTDGREISHGGYADKITEDQAQIGQLQQQLQ